MGTHSTTRVIMAGSNQLCFGRNVYKISQGVYKNYAQAFHIDWATFQNCPINVQIFQIFYGKFENCPINVQNYPINVKCLRTYIAQAFHIDWAVLKFLAFFWHFLKKNLILPNQCEMLAHIYSASISHWLGKIEAFGKFGSFWK